MLTKEQLVKHILAGPDAIARLRQKLEARVADPRFAAKKAQYEVQLAQLAAAATIAGQIDAAVAQGKD